MKDNLRKDRYLQATCLVVLLAVAYSMYVAHYVISAEPEYRIQYVPDDAFYYLTLARNFSFAGSWTFDSGVSQTSGFHPLHAYALAGLHSIFRPLPEQFVRLSVLFSYLLIVPTFVLGGRFLIGRHSLFGSLLFALFVLSRSSSLNTVSALEWTGVVTLSVAYYAMLFKLHSLQWKRSAIALFAIGFTGSLARTDFGLMPACIMAASVMITPMSYSYRWQRLWVTASGLGGAGAGLLAGLVHNFLATGQLLQSSALMKSLWLDFYEPSFVPILGLTLSLFGPTDILTLALCIALTAAILVLGMDRFFAKRLRRESVQSKPSVNVRHRSAHLWLGSLFTIVAYLVFYRLNSVGMQNWYTANLVVPVFLAVSLPVMHGGSKRILVMIVKTVLVVLLVRQSIAAVTFLRRPEWSHQLSMYRAGNFLRQSELDGRTGSWNAGIIGYYQGGSVINLDGLVNNDIYVYAAKNDLPNYIDMIAIDYVIDFDLMFTSDLRRKRGGYDSPVFLERLTPMEVFDNRSSGWRRLTLFRVAR